MNINLDIFKIQSNNVLPSRGKILISEPFLRDATFGRSVILLVDHTEEGTMGLVINKQLPLLLNDVITEFKYLDEIPLYKGGPVATDTLFYLHTLEKIPGSIPVSKGLFLNGDFEEIKKRNITRNHVLEGIWLEEETINSQREVLISFTENIIGKLSDNKIVTKIIDTTNIPKEELLSQFLSFASNINTEILNRKVR